MRFTLQQVGVLVGGASPDGHGLLSESFDGLAHGHRLPATEASCEGRLGSRRVGWRGPGPVDHVRVGFWIRAGLTDSDSDAGAGPAVPPARVVPALKGGWGPVCIAARPSGRTKTTVRVRAGRRRANLGGRYALSDNVFAPQQG